jgi:hypothetical protein
MARSVTLVDINAAYLPNVTVFFKSPAGFTIESRDLTGALALSSDVDSGSRREFAPRILAKKTLRT